MMLITNDLDCNAAMNEFAVRFKQHRVSAHITQKELAEKTGIGLLTFVKLMQGIGLEHNLENIIPDYTKRPSYIANSGNLPKRARKKKTNAAEWKWGDEE